MQEHPLDIEVVEYLKQPPSSTQIKDILDLLQLTPRELMRQKEKIYQTLELDKKNLDDAELIDIMIKHPILIERPIVIIDDKAVMGRPPENVLEIL